jgi:hypothetical protein
VTCAWKFGDSLTHAETILEGSELVYSVSPNYFRLVVRSVIKASSFAFANVAVDYDTTEENGNLKLDISNPLFVKGVSTATISYTVPFGGRLVITKPGGTTIVDTPTLAGAHTYTITSSNIDEVGMWKATVMESGSSSPQIVKIFRVVNPPTTFSHIIDIVFRVPSYLSTSDEFTQIQLIKDKLESELAELFEHFGLQYMSLGVVAGSTSSDYTMRLLATMGSAKDAEAVMCSIVNMMSLNVMGSPVGYVFTTRSSSAQDKITFDVGDVLALMKASVKTRFDRACDNTESIAALATSEKKLYADVFPSATIDPVNQAITAISALDVSTESNRIAAIKTAKPTFVDAVRTVEDSVTTAYSTHDVPLEHTTVEVTSDIPGNTVSTSTGAHAAESASTLSVSSLTATVKDNWKIVAVLITVLVIAVALRIKGKGLIKMIRREA